MVIDHGLVNPGGLRDLVDAGPGKAFSGKFIQGSRQDFFLWSGTLFFIGT